MNKPSGMVVHGGLGDDALQYKITTNNKKSIQGSILFNQVLIQLIGMQFNPAQISPCTSDH